MTDEQFDQLVEWLLDMMEPDERDAARERVLGMPRDVFANLYRRACIKSMQATLNQTLAEHGIEELSNDNRD